MSFWEKVKTCYYYLTKKEVQICCTSCSCCGSPYVKHSNAKIHYDYKNSCYVYTSNYECTVCRAKASNTEIWKKNVYVPDKNSFRIPRHDNFPSEVKEQIMNTFVGRRSV